MKFLRSIILISYIAISYGQVELVWSDEFDGEGAIDDTKWFHQTRLPAGSSWFNGEIQHYTDRVENTFQSNGTLKIKAIKETFTDQGVTKQYTSARLNSKFTFTYGRVEIRAKLPTGVGTWPALWMLGKNITETGAYWQTQGFGTTGWPHCGEVDIMEHWGTNQDYISSAIHSPSSYGSTINLGGRHINGVSTNFNIYTLDWTPESMIFAVNDTVHYTYDPELKNSDTWPFDLEMYLLMNVAILPGIDAAFTEDEMEIDYVRVYKYTNLGINRNDQVPDNYYLEQNYPNPFNPSSVIRFGLPESGMVKIAVYNVNGQEVVEIQNKYLNAGLHSVHFDASDLSTGVYFYSLETSGRRIMKKMSVIK